MADEKRPSQDLISKAIRSERQSNGQVDLDNLNDTLAKSSLWKTNTLRRIENSRSSQNAETGGANDNKDAVLQSLKRSLLQLVDQHWNQRVPGSPANGDVPSEDQRTAPIVDAADTQRSDTKLQNEYNGMRKALSVQVKEVIKVRRRLRKQEKKVKARDEEISQFQKTIAELKAENTGLTEHHERTISELQAENTGLTERHERTIAELQTENTSLKEDHGGTIVEMRAENTALNERHERTIAELQTENASLRERHDRAVEELQAENTGLTEHHKRTIAELQAEYASLKERHDRAVAELQAENTSLSERYTEEITGQQKCLLELQDAYDQFQQQSDELLTELDRENALLRAGETPANDDAQFAPLDVSAQ